MSLGNEKLLCIFRIRRQKQEKIGTAWLLVQSDLLFVAVPNNFYNYKDAASSSD